MPDPMSNVEIEDVLSSIRRLVSDDVRSVETRPRGTETPRVRAPAQAMPSKETGSEDADGAPEAGIADEAPDAEAAQDIADPGAIGSADAAEPVIGEGGAVGRQGEADPATQDALVLTAAQRVAEPPVPSNVRRWTSAANDATRPSVEATRPASGQPGTASLEQTISELEAAVAGIDGEFELDWGSQSDGMETPQDLEAVFRDPSLRDRVTLEAAAASFAVTDDEDEPAANIPEDETDRVLAVPAWDAAPDDDAQDGDAQDFAAAHDDAGAVPSQDVAQDDQAAAADDMLDMPITGDATSLRFGPADDLAAATSASLAALNAATQIAGGGPSSAPTRRLHFGARGDEAAADPATSDRREDTDLPGAAEAETADTDEGEPQQASVAATVDQAMAEVTGTPEAEDLPEVETQPEAEVAIADAPPRHPVIVRSRVSAPDDQPEADVFGPASEPLEAEVAQAGDAEADEAENLFQKSPDQEIDLEALRDLVAEIIRQELQGVLGERITRNVRKLVRREINRVLETRPLE